MSEVEAVAAGSPFKAEAPIAADRRLARRLLIVSGPAARRSSITRGVPT
jgi:hypothetical protein